MNTTDQIITLARRYCIDNHKFWSDKYQNERTGKSIPYTYSDNDYNLFPRYNVLTAILKGVETVVGKSFNSSEFCKNELKKIGLESQTFFTAGKQNQIASLAILDERQKFLKFIDQIAIDQIANVEPLPYRRRILEIEGAEITDLLSKRWNFDGCYWEPLNTCSPELFIFFEKSNLSKEDFDKIKMIIDSNPSRILEVVIEEGYCYEIDSSEFDPDCYETIYTNKTYDWIVYGSHENTIAFGGSWLLKEIETQLSNRKDYTNKW